MGSYSPPYISQLNINFNKFSAKMQGVNRFGQQVNVNGQQNPMLFVNTTLWLGKRELGSQTYEFATTAKKPTPGNAGYPAMSEILPEELVVSLLDKLDSFIDSKIEEYNDTSEESKKAGAAIYPRVNRLEVNVPYNKPAEHFVRILISLYEDENYTRQIVDTDFAVNFASDEFIANASQTIDVEQQAQWKLNNDFFDIKEFFSDTTIQTIVGTVATAFFTVLKSRSTQYKDIDVAVVMAKFQENFAELVQ